MNIYIHSTLLSVGDVFQDPQWMPETADSPKSYIYYVFSYAHIPVTKFNSWIKHSRKLTTVTNHKTK